MGLHHRQELGIADTKRVLVLLSILLILGVLAAVGMTDSSVLNPDTLRTFTSEHAVAAPLVFIMAIGVKPAIVTPKLGEKGSVATSSARSIARLLWRCSLGSISVF